MKKPSILLVNDDGISAPGIKALYESVKDLGDITIVAPDKQKSGASLSFTLHDPVIATPYNWHEDHITAYSVKGTPVDCVKFAISLLMDKKPDLILSGINPTANSGRNILYSGTLGAIIEGTFQNIPGIAFSIENRKFPTSYSLEEEILSIVEYFLKYGIDTDSFLNVTFPHTDKTPFKGIKMATQGKSFTLDDPNNIQIENGRHSFFLGGKWVHLDEEDHSDIELIKKGYTTIVPVHVTDLTRHSMIQKHQGNIEQLLAKKFSQ